MSPRRLRVGHLNSLKSNAQSCRFAAFAFYVDVSAKLLRCVVVHRSTRERGIIRVGDAYRGSFVCGRHSRDVCVSS